MPMELAVSAIVLMTTLLLARVVRLDRQTEAVAGAVAANEAVENVDGARFVRAKIYQQTKGRKMTASNHSSDFVNVNDIRLHYLDWGGTGPTLIFLTGMGSSAYIYSKFAPRFTDRFRVLALTRRGHGDSDYPDAGYDADTLVEDIRQFMDALGVDKASLAGHSLAGVELTHFAATYPTRVEKLIYLDALDDRRGEQLFRPKIHSTLCK